MKPFAILLCLYMIGCGSGSSVNTTAVVTPGPTHGTYNMQLQASRDNNPIQNTTFTADKQYKIYLPAPQDITVTNNIQSDFDVTLMIHNVTCVYHHVATQSNFASVNCNTTDNFGILQSGQSLLFTVDPGVSGLTSAYTNVVVEF